MPLAAALVVQLVLMLGAPVLLAVALRRRWGRDAPWLLVGLGALAWLSSQAVHLPLDWATARLARATLTPEQASGAGGRLLALLAIGFTAGLCEECARWAFLRGTDARGWRAALTFGAGHGGFESVFLGLLVASGAVYLAAAGRIDAETLARSPELAALGEAAATFRATPPWLPLLGGVERLLAIPCHLALTALVMLGVARRQRRWLVLAIAAHAALDAIGVGLARAHPGQPWIAEVAALGFALAALGALAALRRPLEEAASTPAGA